MRNKVLIVALIFLFALTGFAEKSALKGKNVLFVIASENFRDEELTIPKKTVEENGASAKIASTVKSEISGMLGKKVTPDLLLAEVNPSNFDAIVFVGGVGAQKLWDNKKAHYLSKSFNSANKTVAAICLAPVILSRAGIMKEKKGTCFKSAKKEFTQGGAIYVNKNVVIHRNIITASGPDAASEFGKHLVSMIMSPPQTRSK